MGSASVVITIFFTIVVIFQLLNGRRAKKLLEGRDAEITRLGFIVGALMARESALLALSPGVTEEQISQWILANAKFGPG